MSATYQPCNEYRRLGPACASCGRAHDAAHDSAHDAARDAAHDDMRSDEAPLAGQTPGAISQAISSDQLSAGFIEAVRVKALLPDEGLRRRFLRDAARQAGRVRGEFCDQAHLSGGKSS